MPCGLDSETRLILVGAMIFAALSSAIIAVSTSTYSRGVPISILRSAESRTVEEKLRTQTECKPKISNRSLTFCLSSFRYYATLLFTDKTLHDKRPRAQLGIFYRFQTFKTTTQAWNHINRGERLATIGNISAKTEITFI